MGRLGGRQHSLVSPTPAQGSEAFAWVQRPGQTWLTDWGRVPISPSPHRVVLHRTTKGWLGVSRSDQLGNPFNLPPKRAYCLTAHTKG